MRLLIQRRTYIGGGCSEPEGRARVVTGVVPSIILRPSRQAAQGSETAFIPRSGVLSKQAQPFSGLVYCATCSGAARFKINGYGKPGARQALYLCTRPACTRTTAAR